ncbi:VOC family protein [Parathalassolituus penaei]|uniref:VOC family protein n=1 Tax=Parathalassolituus penaei TaxID=2997323 RepID=A0A9X3EHF1_9GAMM|nr:VOC family protein [Parathalassolituus penaei]MCY0966799.1 VOC family protein [Parathalassolituus penaei]
MMHPGFVLLYVNNLDTSVAFYNEFLALQPVEHSGGFALYVLPSGLKFGLWLRETVQPAVTAQAGAMELAIVMADQPALDAQYDVLRHQRVAIAQAPVQMEFGYTCVVLDPDGHRLRLFAPGEA